MTAKRPPFGRLLGFTSSSPPQLAGPGDGGVAVLHGEVEVPRRMPVRRRRHDAAVQPAAIGDRPVRAIRARGLLDRPSEQLAIEGGRGLDVGRDQVVPAQRPGRVDEAGADVGARLPDHEDRALRVLDDRHAPGVEDVEHLAHDRSAELLRACRGAVGVLHGDVAVPVRGLHAGRHRRDGGDVVAVDLGHRVVVAVADRDVLVGPAQQVGIEGLRRFDVVGVQVHPGEGPGRVAGAFAHAGETRRRARRLPARARGAARRSAPC